MSEKDGPILLIEEDSSQRRIMQHYLEEAGYTLHLSDNARDGLMKVRSFNPRLVITGTFLHDSNGFELLSKIKVYNEETPVLVVTAYKSLESAVEAIRLGAFDCLSKPCSREQLLLEVVTLSRTHKLGQNA